MLLIQPGTWHSIFKAGLLGILTTCSKARVDLKTGDYNISSSNCHWTFSHSPAIINIFSFMFWWTMVSNPWLHLFLNKIYFIAQQLQLCSVYKLILHSVGKLSFDITLLVVEWWQIWLTCTWNNLLAYFFESFFGVFPRIILVKIMYFHHVIPLFLLLASIVWQVM